MSDILQYTSIDNGTVSRYIKPSFIRNGCIDLVSFDLRDRKPPEKFVSFHKVDDTDEDLKFISAISYLSFTPKQNGAIILLDVEETLEEVNDEEDDFISFREKDLPHCGMIYHTNDLTKLQEVKTTLSYLALNQFKFVKDINNNLVQVER